MNCVLGSWFLTSLNPQWYPEIRYTAPEAQLVIVGTMTDLRPRVRTAGQFPLGSPSKSQDMISYDEGRRLAEELHASYIECSAKCDSQSVDHVLNTMLWRWHESCEEKKTRKGLDGCILQ